MHVNDNNFSKEEKTEPVMLAVSWVLLNQGSLIVS